METVQYLLSKFITVIVVLSIFLFLYWIGTILFPFLPKTLGISKTNNASSTESTREDLEFFLPTPRKVSLQGTGEGEYPYGRPVTSEDFLRYDGTTQLPEWPQGSKSPVIQNGLTQTGGSADYQTFDPVRAGFSQTAYVRSLSLHRGARVYGGLSFTGEAKEAMFSNAVFTLFVVTPEGQIVGRGEARISDDGARTEWRKFIGRITTQVGYTGKNCTLLFQQQKPNGVRIYFPITCN
ncbi:MAG: hypothetical protein QG653_611 [Patescibacteria group bacterium]|nr:hypothetical protein [Patescibacteria group bacterium]